MMKSIAFAAALLVSGGAMAQGVEVLHWWTSGGEAAALNVLKGNLEKQGVKWNDMPVAGGGGEQAMTALRARVTAGNPPTAVQMLGFDILDWAKQGVVADLNPVAAKEGWDKVVPKALQAFSKYDGKWIAAPVNVHSTNWVWANKEVLAKAGVSEPPKDWDGFVAALDKVQKSGAVALAHGGQPWQEATIFDGVVMSTGGIDFYRKAFVEKDRKALGSDTMLKAFDRMSQLRKYVDKDFSNRDWNLASAMVISGKAGFQVMGDWAKGEFLNAKKVPGKDFLCFRFPGTAGHGELQLRPVRDVQGRRRQGGGAGEAGQRDHGAGLPVGVQRRQGLGAGAHRRARHRVRRLRQEGHEGPGRGQHEEHAGRLDGARSRGAGIDQECVLRRHHAPLQRPDRQQGSRQGDGRRGVELKSRRA